MIKYISSSVAYDFNRKLFVDVSKRKDIGPKWWDVFTYDSYRLEYRMTNGKELTITEDQANSLPLPSLNENENADTRNLPREAVNVSNDNNTSGETQTIEMIKKAEESPSNGPIDIMMKNVLGLPIWVWILGAGTVLYSWKPAFITDIGDSLENLGFGNDDE